MVAGSGFVETTPGATRPNYLVSTPDGAKLLSVASIIVQVKIDIHITLRTSSLSDI